MRIFVLRHAVAEDGRPHLPDRERRLTAAGKEELREVIAGLQRLKVAPDEILASPYRRAWDTALAAARILTPRKRPIELQALTPSGSPERIWRDLKGYPAAKALMVVGHEPLLSQFAAFLLHSPHLEINLKKSGVIRIDVDGIAATRPGGVLRWVLTPGQLSRLG